MLTNAGGDEVHVFAPGNRWGDEALTFEVSTSASSARIERKPQIYTANVAVAAPIRAGGSYDVPFDLLDGTWDTVAAAVALAAPDAQLVALYEIPPSPEALAQNVWTGMVRSNPVPISG